MELRRKLLAGILFWAKLGYEIPRENVRVTKDFGVDKQGKVVGTCIYLAYDVLERPMREVTGILLKHYFSTLPTMKDVKESDLLLDTVVDFGERLLGLQRKAS
jgi:hypothetical protein